jgi:hypothetical protein
MRGCLSLPAPEPRRVIRGRREIRGNMAAMGNFLTGVFCGIFLALFILVIFWDTKKGNPGRREIRGNENLDNTDTL